ncbi:MAG: hypothetical protein P8Y58_02030 [Novosphingobium sp.]
MAFLATLAFVIALASLIMASTIYFQWWLGRIKGRKPKLGKRELGVLAVSVGLFLGYSADLPGISVRLVRTAIEMVEDDRGY